MNRYYKEMEEKRGIKMKVKNYSFLLATAFLLASCSQDNVATVNGKDISKTEFNSYLKFKRLPVKDEQRRKAILDQYIEREAMASMIEKTDVLDPLLIQAELDEFRKEMLISRYFEQFLRDKVTDQAVQNYYTAQEKDYEENKVHVAHILFRTNRSMSDTERKAKLTAAQEAYSKLKTGKDFGEIAQAYSEDKISGKKGGDLGWLKQGAIDSKFSEKAFALKKDEFTEPFETAFGYHIVKLLDGPAVVKKSFEAVKGDIRYQLRNQAKAAELKRMLSESKIKIYE